MVDAIDSKSIDPQGHEGSTPSLDTLKHKDYLVFGGEFSIITGFSSIVACLIIPPLAADGDLLSGLNLGSRFPPLGKNLGSGVTCFGAADSASTLSRRASNSSRVKILSPAL